MDHVTPISVIRGDAPWCLCLGDGVAGLASLPFSSIDAMITDPPFNIAREGGNFQYKGDAKEKIRDFGEWDREGWSPIPMLDASCLALRPGGTLLAFTSTRLIHVYREHTDFKTRSDLVWVKDNPPPNPRPGYVQATEMIMWMQRRGATPVWNGNGYTLNVLKFPVCAGDERTIHPTQKPESLIEDLVRRHTNRGDLVCDPYSGSGTVGAVCRRLGRRFIGWEIDPKYHGIALDRIAATKEQLELVPIVAPKPEQKVLEL